MDARTKNDAQKNDTRSTADREMVITRIVDAPRELVWEAMTNPKHVVNWWGPNGFTNTLEKMDFRVGGVWKHVMHGPDGKDYPNFSTFTAIVKPERIEFLHGGTSKGDPDVQFDATWTFEALGNQTRVTIRAVFPTVEARDTTVKVYNAIEGGKQTLARLAEFLANKAANGSVDREFVISRVFDVPREFMFKVWTDPAHMQRWWGPKDFKVIHSRMDLRPGGSYHYGMKAPDGGTMWGKFVYREIVKPERIVFVDSFSDENGGITRHPMNPSWPLEMLSTITFTEQAGKTTVTVRWAPLNATEDERKTFESGMESMHKGWTGTLDQLAAYLAKA